MQKQMIRREFAAVPDDAFKAATSDRSQPAHPAADRNAGALDAPEQPQPLEEHPAARP